MGIVVAHGVGDEPHVVRGLAGRFFDRLPEKRFRLLLGLLVPRVAGVGSDQEQPAQLGHRPLVRRFLRQLEAFALDRFAEANRGPQLCVFLAAVADKRNVERIQRVVFRVDVVQRGLLIRRQPLFGQPRARVLPRFRVARARLERREKRRVLNGQPRRPLVAAHGVAANHDALRIDVVVLSHGGNGLVDIGLGVELVRVVHAREGLELDVVIGRNLRCLVRPRLLLHESNFVHLHLRAVQPHIEAHRPLAVVGGGNRQAVGL